MERKSRLVELSLVIMTSMCVSPEVNRTMVPSTASMSGSAPAGVVGRLLDGAVVDGVVLALAEGPAVVDVAVVGEDPGGWSRCRRTLCMRPRGASLQAVLREHASVAHRFYLR